MYTLWSIHSNAPLHVGPRTITRDDEDDGGGERWWSRVLQTSTLTVMPLIWTVRAHVHILMQIFDLILHTVLEGLIREGEGTLCYGPWGRGTQGIMEVESIYSAVEGVLCERISM